MHMLGLGSKRNAVGARYRKLKSIFRIDEKGLETLLLYYSFLRLVSLIRLHLLQTSRVQH